MVKMAAICAALLSCLVFAPAAANAAPSQPPYFTVSLVTANGTGCPAGSAAVSQVNSTVFTVTYSKYTAFAGGGVSPILRRLNCELDVQVGVPSGWTYGILEVDYRGYAYLDNDASGKLAADYYFAGQPITQHQQHTIYGPKDYNYTLSDYAGVMAWAPCHFNATLNVDTSVRVSPGDDTSFANELTMDSSVVGLGTLYHLGFRRC
jgi:hypothetical protein